MNRGALSRRTAACLLAVVLGVPGSAHAQAPEGPYADVPPDHWAAAQIEYVADDARAWIPARQEGFGPGDHFTRRDLVRALVVAFPPPSSWVDQSKFSDLPVKDADHLAADYAVRRFRARVFPNGEFRPGSPTSRAELDSVLVWALGYTKEASAVSGMKTENGQKLAPSWTTGFVVVADRLGLHGNLPASLDAEEIRPGQPAPRAHAAFAFAEAAKVAADRGAYAWRVAGFLDIELPSLSPARLAAVRFALRYAGFPYIWGGEWPQPTDSSYPYGTQAQGGFDCTGLAWLVLQRPETEGYDVTRWRPYEGWTLRQRTATDMADATRTRIALGKTLPLDIAFFDLNNDPARIEHAGILLGNGWMLHASGARSGVTLERLSSWWQSRFVTARRVIPAAS